MLKIISIFLSFLQSLNLVLEVSVVLNSAFVLLTQLDGYNANSLFCLQFLKDYWFLTTEDCLSLVDPKMALSITFILTLSYVEGNHSINL